MSSSSHAWCGLLALAASPLAACGGNAPDEPRARGPNVVLVLVDTLGAKHLGCYGAPGAHTPAIDRLAAEGLRFAEAYAPAPWTKPSVASLFTGTLPSRHGVQSLLAGGLAEEFETMAERFRAAGYRTHGVISHVLLRAQYGYRQGFEGWDESSIAGHDGISGRRVTDRALEWLERAGHAGEAPFFLFVHYFDPHYAYQDQPGIDLIAGYRGRLRPGMPVGELRARRAELGPADVDFLVNLYREEIAYTDREIARLLARLDALAREDTLVVLTADHGEELMDHGWIGHTRTLYDELLQVPLILRWPGVIAPGVSATPVSLVDVLPTVVELAALGAPDPRWEGRSLAALARGGAAELAGRDLFSEVHFEPADGESRSPEGRASKTALMRGGWKLIHDRARQRFELFERTSDPREQRDRFGEDPRRDEELTRALLAFEASRPPPAPADAAPPAPEEQRELDDLGYGK